MFEGISKNWGYLTTIGVIVGVAFGAGIWVKGSLDTLEDLPEQVKSLEERVRPLEDIHKVIDRAKCALAALTDMSGAEMRKYANNLHADEAREQVSLLDILERERVLEPHENRRYDRLEEKERNLRKKMDENQLRYELQLQIYGQCK